MSFWIDNWLGYRLADRLHIPDHVLSSLTCSVGDYLIDGVWYFTLHFITRHLDVVIGILQTPIHSSDQRIWPSLAIGILTSKMAYDFLRSPLHMSWAPWIWAPFIPQIWAPWILDQGLHVHIHRFLPFTYLGVHIFKGAPKVEHFSPIADSILAIFSR